MRPPGGDGAFDGKGPSAALIATTFNCKEGLESALDTFGADDCLDRIDEIVIVDGGSTDGTWELLRHWAESTPKARAFQVRGANISRGRNEAIRRAERDVIVCFDSGCRYRPEWLAQMLRPFREEGATFVGAHTDAYGTTPFERCLALFYDRRDRSESYNPSHRGVAYRRQVWEAVGGYPEEVLAGEDTWFNTQARKAGFRFRYAPEARVGWRVRADWGQTFRMTRRNTRGHMAIGETTGTPLLLLIAGIHLALPVFAGLGILHPAFPLGWVAAYALYVLRRLLRGGRVQAFLRPAALARGWRVILAFDLGITLGVVQGLTDRLKRALRRRRDASVSGNAGGSAGG